MCYDGNHSGSISLPRFAFYVTILQLKTNDKKRNLKYTNWSYIKYPTLDILLKCFLPDRYSDFLIVHVSLFKVV